MRIWAGCLIPFEVWPYTFDNDMESELDLVLVGDFLALVEERHFGRAAKRRFVTQPALTKRIRRLESSLGVRLFDRDRSGVTLTTAGTAFEPLGRRVLDQAEVAIGAARQAGRLDEGVVRVGFLAATPRQITQRLLHLDDPVVELHRVEWADQIGCLQRGEVDMSIVRLPLRRKIGRAEPLIAEPRYAAFHREHHLAQRDAVTLDDIAGELIVKPETQRDFWTVNPRPDGSSPRWGPPATSIEEMLELVASGRCMCITSQSVVDQYSRPDIAYVAMPELPPSEIALAWLPRADTAVARMVRDHIVGVAAEPER